MKDLIDRQAAIDALDKRFDSIPMEQTAEILQLRKDLRELPSAQPEIEERTTETVQNVSDGDLISRKAAIERIDEALSRVIKGPCGEKILARVPSAQQKSYREGYQAGFKDAQPERKKGKWNITDAYPHNVYCSECYTRFAQTHWAVWEDGSLPRNFCPHCGAKMERDDGSD